MKRIALLFIIAIYSLSCLGVTINSVYCCDKLLSSTITRGEDQKVDCNMGPKIPGCCKTKKQHFKIKDQHFGSTALKFDSKLFSFIYITNAVFNVNQLNFRPVYTAFNSHAPPNKIKAPFYILHCTYRI